MEKEKIQEVENKIIELVMDLNGKKEKRAEIYNEVVPAFPTLKDYYSISEYLDFVERKSKYNAAVQRKSYGSEGLKREIEKIEDEIISLLPVSCVWFKINDVFVGYQTNDWPGSRPELKVVFNNPDGIDLPSIKFKTIN